MKMCSRGLAGIALMVVIGAYPVVADQHCNPVEDALLEAYAVLSPMTGETDPVACEAELDVARSIVEAALPNAKACGCVGLEAGVLGILEQSRSPEYECWNRRQGVRTNLGHGIGNYCCYGC